MGVGDKLPWKNNWIRTRIAFSCSVRWSSRPWHQEPGNHQNSILSWNTLVIQLSVAGPQQLRDAHQSGPREPTEWAKEVNHHRIHFDQCRLGQVARKSTTFSMDLPLHHWQGLQCNHGEHTRSPAMTSSDLSRYPPTLMTGLAAAIIRSLPDKGLPATGCQQTGERPPVGLIVPLQSPSPKP